MGASVEWVHLWTFRLVLVVAKAIGRSSVVASQKWSIKMNRQMYFCVCLWVWRLSDELTGNCMLSRKGQCKWTCRLTPFQIAFILLHRLEISVNNYGFIWAKTSFPCLAQVSYFSVFGCKICTHERREHYATDGCLPHQATCLVWFGSSALISYSLILARAPFSEYFKEVPGLPATTFRGPLGTFKGSCLIRNGSCA